jgi:hypothetical protein
VIEDGANFSGNVSMGKQGAAAAEPKAAVVEAQPVEPEAVAAAQPKARKR